MCVCAQRPEYHRATISWDDASSAFIALSTGGQRSRFFFVFVTLEPRVE
jgi:hypothetical protein